MSNRREYRQVRLCLQWIYCVDPAKNGATRRSVYRRRTPDDITSLSHQIFSFCLYHRLQRWQLLHLLRNGSLTSIRHLLQSQSLVEFQTLLGSHLLEARWHLWLLSVELCLQIGRSSKVPPKQRSALLLLPPRWTH
jgi:hypothetical protein